MVVFVSLASQSKASDKTLSEALVNGKWINKSGGYVTNSTYDAKTAQEGESVRTTKRYKTFGFDPDHSFILDSAKQRYTGKWEIVDQEIHLHFHSKVVSHLRKKHLCQLF